MLNPCRLAPPRNPPTNPSPWTPSKIPHLFLSPPPPTLQLPLETALLLAASAESGSEHPLAQAVLGHAAGALGLGGTAQQAQQQQGPPLPPELPVSYDSPPVNGRKKRMGEFEKLRSNKLEPDADAAAA